jgi:hypothetical protein
MQDDELKVDFFGRGNMKGISKFKVFIWGTNSRMTNMSNDHTYTIGGVDLICTIVLLTDRKFLQFSRDAVGGTGGSVPVVVDRVGVHRSTSIPFFQERSPPRTYASTC